MKTAIITVVVFLTGLFIWVDGPPRVLGLGCDDAPFGLPQLANEEDDFTRCDKIIGLR